MKMEYMVIKRNSADEVEKQLNELAKDGWKLISMNVTFTSFGIPREYILVLGRDKLELY
jgi:hypothetical protein